MKGKTAILTGGGSGMSKATAILFASQGANVIIADINEAAAEKVLDSIRNKDQEAISIR